MLGGAYVRAGICCKVGSVLAFVGCEMEDLESLVVKLRKRLEEAAQEELQVSTNKSQHRVPSG